MSNTRGLNEYYLGRGKTVGHVYIGRVYTEPSKIKIGRTVQPLIRLTQLQKEYGNRFELIALSKKLWNYIEAEEMLLNTMDTEPCAGEEWFQVGSLQLEVLFEDIKRLENASFDLFDNEAWNENTGVYSEEKES